jgi:hypothetical protein
MHFQSSVKDWLGITTLIIPYDDIVSYHSMCVIISSELTYYKSPWTSMLREEDLQGNGLVLEIFMSRLSDIGLYYYKQERMHAFVSMLRDGGFLLDSISGDVKVDVIKLLKFCKEYLERRSVLPLYRPPAPTHPSTYHRLGTVSEELTKDLPSWYSPIAVTPVPQCSLTHYLLHA